MNCAADLLWSRCSASIPNIRFALSEGVIGWIPYLLERADYVYEHHQPWTGPDFGGSCRRRSSATTSSPASSRTPPGFELLDLIGVDIVTGSPTTRTRTPPGPTAPERLASSLADVSKADIDAMTHRNAMRDYSFDPFAHRKPEECTVAGLRAESPDVDMTLISAGGTPPSGDEVRPVTSLDITQQLAHAFEAPSST